MDKQTYKAVLTGDFVVQKAKKKKKKKKHIDNDQT